MKIPLPLYCKIIESAWFPETEPAIPRIVVAVDVYICPIDDTASSFVPSRK